MAAVRSPAIRRLGRALRRGVPLAVWLAAIAGVLLLLPYGGRTSTIVGLVAARRSSVVVPVAGTLAAVTVERHSRVEAGQVVGRLGDDELRLRLAQTRFQLEELRADLRRGEAEIAHDARRDQARQRHDAAVEVRRRASAVETAHLDELGTQAEIEEARIRVQGLNVEAARQTALEQQGIASDAELVRIRTDQSALQRRIAELEGVLAEQRARTAAARQRLQEFAGEDPGDVPADAILEPMRWRLKAQEALLERIALEGRKLDLVAPIAGYVEELHLTAGQWVGPGTRLLSIVDPDARQILAYVPQEVRTRVRVNGDVQVLRQGMAAGRSGTVLSVSPAMVPLPLRLRRDPRVEEWGFEIVLAAADDEAAGLQVSVVPRR